MNRGMAVWPRPVLLSLLGVALSLSVVQAQSTGVTSQTVGSGYIEYTDVVGGETDVFMFTPTFEPGGSLGWHIHPGPVFVVVRTGEITVYAADGCPTTYAAGSGFTMPPGHIMDVRNETGGTVELAATALVPAGLPRASNVTAPTAICTQ